MFTIANVQVGGGQALPVDAGDQPLPLLGT